MTSKLTKEEVAEAVWYDGGAGRAAIEPYEVPAAYGDLGDYGEGIYVLLVKDGQLFEYEDSHCSCNGFDWNPQPVTAAYLAQRYANGGLPYEVPESEVPALLVLVDSLLERGL